MIIIHKKNPRRKVGLSICLLYLCLSCTTLNNNGAHRHKDAHAANFRSTDNTKSMQCRKEGEQTCSIRTKTTKQKHFIEIAPAGEPSFIVAITKNISTHKNSFYKFNAEHGLLYNGVLYTDASHKPQKLVMSIVDRKDQAKIFDLTLQKAGLPLGSGSHVGKCTIKGRTSPCKITISQENSQDLRVYLTSKNTRLGNSFNLNDTTTHPVKNNLEEIVSWSKQKNKQDYLKLKVSRKNNIIGGLLELRDVRGSKNKVRFFR